MADSCPCFSTIPSGFLQTAKLNLHQTTNFSCMGNRFCVFPLPKNSLLAAGAAPFQHTKASLSSFKMKFRRGLGFKRKLRSPIYFWTSKNGINGTNAVVDAANKWNPCIVFGATISHKNPSHQWLETQRCNTKTCLILRIFIVFLHYMFKHGGCIPDSDPDSDFLCCSTCGKSGSGFSPTLHPWKSNSGGNKIKALLWKEPTLARVNLLIVITKRGQKWSRLASKF